MRMARSSRTEPSEVQIGDYYRAMAKDNNDVIITAAC